MKRIAIGLLLATASGPSWGQTCTSLPYALTNGTVANADQVMADLNCLALKGAGTFTGDVSVSNTAPDGPNIRFRNSASNTWSFDAIDATNSRARLISEGGASGNVERLTILENGKVGIGTASPIQLLDLTTAELDDGIAIRNSSATGGRLRFYSTGAGGRNYSIESTANSSGFGGGNFVISDLTASDAARVVVTSTGNVGVGTTSPSKLLYVNGSAGGTQSWNQASDGRLKTNITPVTGGLALIEQLNPVRYDWRKPVDRSVGKELNLPVGERQIGFIAQEVEKVVPEAVTTPAKGSSETYGLKQDNLIPVLVAAIKEQQAAFEEQRMEIKALRDQVAAQHDQIEALKAKQ